jgi:DNA (cytosine-5)-methyltransferase 1
VSGLISIDKGLVLERVFTDLEGEGYQVQPFVVPACAVGAPHRRDRIWIVANRTQHMLNRTGTHRQEWRGEFADTDVDAANTKHDGQFTSKRQCKTEKLEQQQGRKEKQKSAVKPERSNTRSPLHAPNPSNQGPQRRSELGKQKKKRQTAPGGRQDVAGCCGEDAADTIGQYDDHGRHGAGQILRERREAPEIQRCRDAWNEPWIEAATRLCGIHDGGSCGLDRTNRLKALGNAIVPQVAAEIFKAIRSVES